MIHFFIEASAASAGSGLTYLRNVVPHLAVRSDVRATILLASWFRREFPAAENISFLEISENRVGTARSFLRNQKRMPDLIRRSGADILISTGNVALLQSPVPQILLSGNSLYTSADFARDLRVRREYRLWLDTRIKAWIAKKSVRIADCTVAPSHSFASELRRWTGVNVITVHHGFDREIFFRDPGPLPDDVESTLRTAEGDLRLLFVSHYNYYRNFETLVRALPLIQKRLRGRKAKLIFTCKFRSEDNPGSYRAEAAAALVKRLAITSDVLELGAIPYRLLHLLYRACDMYVTPAYTETFAHPLVEAMATGLPVVASDLSVHHEVCGLAARYFPRFSPEELADRVGELVASPALSHELSQRGLERSRDFTWSKHVDRIVAVSVDLLSNRRANPRL